VPKGLTQQFTATGTLSDNSTQDLTNQVTWASSTTSVASISNTAGSKGLATAVAQGTSTISATLNGITGSTTLTVTAPVLQSIAVTPADPSVPKGLTQQFTATGTLSDSSTEDLTGQVTWASSKTTAATITAAGLATAVAQGTATLSATLNGVTGSTVITVTAPVLQSIAVTPANPSVPKGENEPFTATGTFSDGSTKALTSTATWASGKTTVATITAAGLAAAVAQGTSTISATLDGVTGSTVLTVGPAVLLSIAVGPDKPTIVKGKTQQFTATGTFSDASTEDLTTQVTWASSTASVATIDATGLATGVTPGTSTISATLDGITGSTSLLVISAPLSSIAITPADPSVPKGLTEQFTATGTFTDGSTGDLTNQVTWASATASVATISNTTGSQGLANALAQGTSSISATLNGISGSTTLTVTAPVLRSIAVTPADPSVPKGLTQQFTATGTLSDNSTEDLTDQATWASGKTTVATITAAGLATAIGQGTSSVSATFNGITGSTVLTVTAPVVRSIAVTPASPSVPEGLTQQFTATGTLSDGSTENLASQVTWASATTSVATITAAGLATATGQGTSTISATLNGISGSTVLTVTPAVLVSLAISPGDSSIVGGTAQAFTAIGTFSDHSTRDLTGQVAWSSAADSVATITAAGLATGVGPGTSAISATLGGIRASTILTVMPAPVAVNHVQYAQNKKHQVDQITISFGGALNAAEASNPASYRLVMPDKRGSFTSKKAKAVPLKSAVYNAALGQVTLTPRKPVALKKPVELVIPVGLHDGSGRLIDGGKTVVFVLGRQGVTVGSVAVSPSGRPLVVLEATAVDAVLDHIVKRRRPRGRSSASGIIAGPERNRSPALAGSSGKKA
jgi:hypothetical protein